MGIHKMAENIRKIIHIDMDCFYAAVETKYNPQYKGRPLGVGGPPNSRSVLCTANYEARKFGVKAAMPSSRAVRLCPGLILVPPNFSLYRAESKAVRAILEKFTDKIEPLSLDEAYLDVTDCKEFAGSATLIAKEIRRQIYENCRLTASAGIAPNKFLAKVASDWKKPNNQFTISPNMIEAFMPDLPVECIFGIGKVTANKLHEKGIKTCKDIHNLQLYELKKFFGNRSQDILDLSRGIDRRPVCTHWQRKSLTVEETFNVDLNTFDEIESKVEGIYNDWISRMDKGQYWNRLSGWVVKLKFFDFQGTTHEVSNHRPPKLEDFIHLIESAYGRQKKPVRLIGLGARLKDAESISKQEQFDLDSAS